MGRAIPVVRPFGKDIFAQSCCCILPVPACSCLHVAWLAKAVATVGVTVLLGPIPPALKPGPSIPYPHVTAAQSVPPLCFPFQHYLRTLWHDWGGTLAGQEQGVGTLPRASPGIGTLTGISTLLRDLGSPRDQDSAGQGLCRATGATVAFVAHPCQEHMSPVPRHGRCPLPLGWSIGTRHHPCPEWGCWGGPGTCRQVTGSYWDVVGPWAVPA